MARSPAGSCCRLRANERRDPGGDGQSARVTDVLTGRRRYLTRTRTTNETIPVATTTNAAIRVLVDLRMVRTPDARASFRLGPSSTLLQNRCLKKPDFRRASSEGPCVSDSLPPTIATHTWHACRPRWTVENRQFVDRAKPAISGTAETSEFYFVPSSVRNRSAPWYASSEARI